MRTELRDDAPSRAALLPPDVQLPLDVQLREALASEQLRLVYQPQVNLSTGHIVGFEALLRWDHPARGTLLPAEFIACVDECSVVSDVTCFVVREAIAQLRRWEDMGHHGLQVAINAPPCVFDLDDVTLCLSELLSRHEIACNQVQIDLTEHTLNDATVRAIQHLEKLRDDGVSVAVDDFGTGHLSLGALTRLPLDCLKIDARVVRGAVSDPSDAMVARICCDIARRLQVRVVAEGIETPGQLRFFTDLRCDLAQGGFFAQPLAAQDATAMLQGTGVYRATQEAPGTSRHLLLLDDEPNILRALRRVFRAQALTVHTAQTPDEAFELLARHPVGVVMSDQRMPLMRGTDFLARVKNLYPDTVRIVLSGYTELQSVTDAINEGAIYKFLTKPWNDVQLNEEIDQAFRQFEMVAEGHRLQQRLRDSNKLLESRLLQNKERLHREEAALDVTHEALSVVPVPILGVDGSGMIAISNAAADALLGGGSSVVGEHINDVLPSQGASDGFAGPRKETQVVRIGDAMYEVRFNDLGPTSRGAGTVITLIQGARA
jgi:EAL domain-containing protein (putative c-di-GMP-specific phosphodiesterase class I)/FixJ family two-component response regulator